MFGVTMVMFGTVRANGAVFGPLIILVHRRSIRSGSASRWRTYGWLGADAIWWASRSARPRQHGAGHRLLSARRLAQAQVLEVPPEPEEHAEATPTPTASPPGRFAIRRGLRDA